jgi:hypothetical protein
MDFVTKNLARDSICIIPWFVKAESVVPALECGSVCR